MSLYNQYLDPQDAFNVLALTAYEVQHRYPHFIYIPSDAHVYVRDSEGQDAFYKVVNHQIEVYTQGEWQRSIYANLESLIAKTKLLWAKNKMKKTASTQQELTEHPPRPETPVSPEIIEAPQALTDFTTARTATQIAQDSMQHIADRASTYDSPQGERSAKNTVTAFNAITGKTLSEAELYLILQLLKDVRQWQAPNYHKDSAEDAIAYAVLKAEALEQSQ